jgi:large subunit ribosomal protein L4
MKLEVKNTAGQSVGSIELADDVFAAPVHEHLLWEVVKWQLAKRRAGNASTKRMGEVRGSTIKAWKQKGTGRARQGSRKGPHWVGGGSVFGPKPRSYAYAMPRKAKKAALRSALSLRAGEQKLIVVDKFDTDGKTKAVATALAALGVAQPTSKVLIVDVKDNALLARGSRNLPASTWLAPEGLNVYDILRHETVVITQASIKSVEAALAGAAGQPDDGADQPQAS